ncbi:unnamed protein product [Rotaria magnacalcarata]|uniref:Major facilitator superfamily (MFS) profile domain-containing protein n=1 Tax=Rotaria magnacalcarata TaxID=392030 RepID=A0A816NBE8_9BILA|nr:unnamed protein product [Rotaria magnacalcarata]CAF2045334.1 unnamed protein product [Rotaria magnacalcarata]CAF3949892.1 unnamed protein product [Rotaria magnacalcarata]CAF4067956.1 unnamed protein product [Rotaria magnacalcarata]
MDSATYAAGLASLNIDLTDGTTSKSSSTTKSISLDGLIRLCGDLGPFQFIHFFFINLISMSAGMVAFYYVYGAAEPKHRCQLSPSVWPNDVHYLPINQTHEFYINAYIPKEKDGIWNKCMRYTMKDKNSTLLNCPNGWAYDRSVFGYTFTEEANLVCYHEPKKSWMSTLMQTGGFSLLLIGSLGDKYGRRKTTIITTIFLCVMCVLTQIFMQWIPMTVDTKFGLLLLNQLVSGLTVSTYSVAFILMLELTSAAHTSLVGNIALVAFTIGEAILTLCAYLTFDWELLKWTNTFFIALVLPYLYFMPETPFYLCGKRQYTELEALLRRIATRNNRFEAEWYPSYQEFLRDQSMANVHNERKIPFHQQLRQLFSNRNSLIKLFIINLIGFTTYLLYYEISYGLEVLNISPYIGILIGAVVEAAGYISSSLLIVTKLGRKGSFILMLGLTTVCVLMIPFVEKHSALASVFIAQFGKYTVSGAISVSWIFVPELFQTSIRSSANGLFIAFSHLGAIIAPVINTSVNETYLPITYYASSALAFIVVLLTMLLPETKDRTMDA